MKQYILLISSIILFLILFFILNKPIVELMTTTNTETNTTTINPQSIKVDSNALNQDLNQLIELKEKLTKIRGILYDKSLSKVLQIKSKYKDLDNDSNPQQFDVTIEKLEDFSNIINIEVAVGKKGIQGPEGNKGKKGLQGKEGEKGVEGNCGAIL